MRCAAESTQPPALSTTDAPAETATANNSVEEVGEDGAIRGRICNTTPSVGIARTDLGGGSPVEMRYDQGEESIVVRLEFVEGYEARFTYSMRSETKM